MAIGTNSAIEYFGTADTLGTTSALVLDAGFSIASDLSTWVNDDDAMVASLVFSATYSVAPDANSSVALFIRPLDISSTNDQDVPTANFQHSYVGSFPVKDVTTAQFSNINISLPNHVTSQNFEFYIQNNTGQTIPAGWDLIITPKAIGPAA